MLGGSGRGPLLTHLQSGHDWGSTLGRWEAPRHLPVAPDIRACLPLLLPIHTFPTVLHPWVTRPGRA